MALPINIEDLLGRNVVESNRIEYKAGWNPDSIYRTICAFANDFEDSCGGYIVVGVEENNGRPVRPVKGVDLDRIDHIGKEMVGYNNLIMPYYQPRVFFEKVDGKIVMVIWVAAGERRPYKVPDLVTAKNKNYSYYIRYNSSSIVAKEEYFNELMDLANKAPFDDRGNIRAKMSDVSMLLIRDYLAEIKSSMVDEMETLTPRQVLEQLNLLEGPDEQARIKNVALMMFCYKPERFFPGTQIDIVFYPEGKEGDPNNFTETEPFRGPVHVALRKALDYLRSMVIRRNIHKPKDDEHSIVVYNYPYQAIEEALVNAYFHRSYDSYQPVEVNIQPNQIEIISYGGAERSIKLNDLRAGRRVHARRYRNARLGEFFKELHLTEGRGTGLPTIHDELQRNGSPEAIIDADDEHTYFMITIPCHPEFVCDKFTLDKDGHVLPVLKGDVTENRANVTENVTEKANNAGNVTKNITDVTKNVTKNPKDAENVTQNDDNDVTEELDSSRVETDVPEAEARRLKILQLLKITNKITVEELSNVLSVSRRTVLRDLELLRFQGKIERIGGSKGGSWSIKEL